MAFQLPPLPFDEHALEPFISSETLRYHYGKHHKAYCDKLNELIKGTAYEDLPLEEIIRTSEGPIFNNAAQFWNHNFYWQCLKSENSGKMSAELEEALKSSFGSVDSFKKQFAKAGLDQFGSGWAWLNKNDDGRLSIEKTSNAENPIQNSLMPLLTMDVWEHAYYIDYQNDRAKYTESFWAVVNWEFVAQCFSQAQIPTDRSAKNASQNVGTRPQMRQ